MYKYVVYVWDIRGQVMKLAHVCHDYLWTIDLLLRQWTYGEPYIRL